MSQKQKLAELRSLSARALAIRGKLGISAPGEVIFESDMDALSDKVVVVEADGFGGAKTSVWKATFRSIT